MEERRRASEGRWNPDREAAKAEYLTDRKVKELKLFVRGKAVKCFSSLEESLPWTRNGKLFREKAAVLLHIAARFHDVEELHRGLSQGFVTTDTLYLTRTALQWAIINSAGAPPENPAVRDTVKFLLEAGADPQTTVYGDSLGAIALRNDQVETAFDLLKHLQKDIQSLNPCNLPDPNKHSGLWGYMLTSKDAQLSCETLDWMSDDMIKLFPEMPLGVQMKLFASCIAHEPSVIISGAAQVPAVVLPSHSPLETPFHLRRKNGQTLLQYIFNKMDVFDEHQLKRFTSMLTELSKRISPNTADCTPWVFNQLQAALDPDSLVHWIGKILPTVANSDDVDLVLLGRRLPLDTKFDGRTLLQILVGIAKPETACASVVDALITDGADLLVDGNQGMTLVNTAIENDQVEIAWLLLKKLQSFQDVYPLMKFLRSDGVQKVKVKYPQLWGLLATTENALKQMTDGLVRLDEETMNFLFSELPLEHQVALFGPRKPGRFPKTIHISNTNFSLPDNSPPPEPLHMVLHEGRSLLQHIADKRDLVAKQREDFTWMIIRIDQHIHPDSSSDRVDRVIQVLKDGIETSDFLHAWTESVKNKLPLPKPVMWLQNSAALFFLFLGLSLFVVDLVTDGLVNKGFHSNANFMNRSELLQEGPNVSSADEHCHCRSTILSGLENDAVFRYDSQQWRTLFWISTVHLCLPWFLFILVGLSEHRSNEDGEDCLALFHVLFFPLAILFRKCILQIKLNMNMTQDDSEQKKENYENLRASLDKIEKQEILFLVIEVTSESSFQFFLQTILAMPQVFLALTAAYTSETPFLGHMFSLRLISILSSFIVIARSYYKIRDLAKKGALPVFSASGLLLLLRTLIDTVIRIMSAGLLLYMLDGHMNPTLALMFYYLHCLIMVAFNLVFNIEKLNSGSARFWRNLFLDSLSSQYSYTHFEFTSLIRGKKQKKDGVPLHQPSLIRQGAFYLLLLLESVVISIASCFAFDYNSIEFDGTKVMMVTNGFGEEFPFSRKNLTVILNIIWFLQLLVSPVLLLLYYAAHPSSVSISAIKPKLQVFKFSKIFSP